MMISFIFHLFSTRCMRLCKWVFRRLNLVQDVKRMFLCHGESSWSYGTFHRNVDSGVHSAIAPFAQFPVRLLPNVCASNGFEPFYKEIYPLVHRANYGQKNIEHEPIALGHQVSELEKKLQEATRKLFDAQASLLAKHEELRRVQNNLKKLEYLRESKASHRYKNCVGCIKTFNSTM